MKYTYQQYSPHVKTNEFYKHKGTKNTKGFVFCGLLRVFVFTIAR